MTLSCADLSGLCDGTPANSISQQLVDRGFCPRRLIDAFDDHRAIEAGNRSGVLGRLAWQRARNDDRIARHLPPENYPGLRIDVPVAGPVENPLARNPTLAPDHALGNLE